jgi:hypothetical protein
MSILGRVGWQADLAMVTQGSDKVLAQQSQVFELDRAAAVYGPEDTISFLELLLDGRTSYLNSSREITADSCIRFQREIDMLPVGGVERDTGL